MERIDNLENVDQLKENKIIFQNGKDDISFVKSQAVFIGKNNILFIENANKLSDSLEFGLKYIRKMAVIYRKKKKWFYYI